MLRIHSYPLCGSFGMVIFLHSMSIVSIQTGVNDEEDVFVMNKRLLEDRKEYLMHIESTRSASKYPNKLTP